MRIYYYHTRPILPALEEWKEFKHPGHILYGLTHFERNGVDTVIHPFKAYASRLRLMIYNLITILSCKQSYDVLYGTSYRGLELLIFLRALGLYRKPIAIWHHQAVPASNGYLKNQVSKFFYKGLDCLFFFSRALIEDSLSTRKVRAERLHLIHWGADLDFYDHLIQVDKPGKKDFFISTGKENRDFQTLLQAFAATQQPLEVYTSSANGDQQYDTILQAYADQPHIRIHFVKGIIPYELALKVASSQAVVISCLNFPYTVGLTTLVEALALGIPLITSRNPKFEMDIDHEEAGITVAYGDVNGWEEAIRFLQQHPEKAVEMGQNGRHLAEQTYNLENYTKELADILKTLARKA